MAFRRRTDDFTKRDGTLYAIGSMGESTLDLSGNPLGNRDNSGRYTNEQISDVLVDACNVMIETLSMAAGIDPVSKQPDYSKVGQYYPGYVKTDLFIFGTILDGGGFIDLPFTRDDYFGYISAKFLEQGATNPYVQQMGHLVDQRYLDNLGVSAGQEEKEKLYVTVFGGFPQMKARFVYMNNTSAKTGMYLFVYLAKQTPVRFDLDTGAPISGGPDILMSSKYDRQLLDIAISLYENRRRQ